MDKEAAHDETEQLAAKTQNGITLVPQPSDDPLDPLVGNLINLLESAGGLTFYDRTGQDGGSSLP